MLGPVPPRLLVVDWDYFFPNPLLCEHTDAGVESPMLYDWTTIENADRQDRLAGLTDFVWGTRMTGFVRNGLPVPMPTDDYRTFWQRFTFAPGAEAWAADSNAYCHELIDRIQSIEIEGLAGIDLFDAHHDAYEYPHPKLGTADCGNWMSAAHEMDIHNLNVYYPPWRDTIDGAEKPPAVPVNRTIDEPGRRMPHPYTHVFVCRSGAWVPPWCDYAFAAFLTDPLLTPLPMRFPGGRNDLQIRALSLPDLYRDVALAGKAFSLGGARVQPYAHGDADIAAGLETGLAALVARTAEEASD